eukprot:3902668-Ditylum_brightwellii.AAC.1
MEEIEELLNDATFDNPLSEKEINKILKKQEANSDQTANIKENLEWAYSYYNGLGHFMEENNASATKTFQLKTIYSEGEQVCGGISKGDKPRVCLAHNYTTARHKKNRFGLKMSDTLYLAILGNLCYPLPI